MNVAGVPQDRTYIFMYVLLRIEISICGQPYVRIYACMFVRMYACRYVSMYMYVCTNADIYTGRYVSVRVYERTSTRADPDKKKKTSIIFLLLKAHSRKAHTPQNT